MLDASHPPLPVLPPFVGLNLDQIHLITSAQQAQQVLPLLLAQDALGFDTESQPVFIKGQAQSGPHLIQLASDTQAFLFPLTGADAPLEELREILLAPQVLKVGFGLKNDQRAMLHKLAYQCAPILDLARALREGKKAEVGAKTAVQRFFNQEMRKPKSISTSNWGRNQLTAQQLLYAANDAYVALKVYRRWRELGGRAKYLK